MVKCWHCSDWICSFDVRRYVYEQASLEYYIMIRIIYSISMMIKWYHILAGASWLVLTNLVSDGWLLKVMSLIERACHRSFPVEAQQPFCWWLYKHKGGQNFALGLVEASPVVTCTFLDAWSWCWRHLQYVKTWQSHGENMVTWWRHGERFGHLTPPMRFAGERLKTRETHSPCCRRSCFPDVTPGCWTQFWPIFMQVSNNKTW